MRNTQEKIIKWITSNAILILIILVVSYVAVLFLFRRYHWLPWLFDDADKTNIVQIILFIGIILVLYESIRMREIEYQPVLSLFIKGPYYIYSKNEEIKKKLRKFKPWLVNYDQNHKFCFAVRNTGKGVGLDLKIEVLKDDRSVNGSCIIEQEQYIISHTKDEVRFKINGLSSYNCIKIKISAESISGKMYSYFFKVKDISKRCVIYLEKNEK